MKDYYKILDVPTDASPEEIKKAYIILAKKIHPDTAEDKVKAEAEMKELNEAYDTLSDDNKRIIYDEDYNKATSFDITLEDRERLRRIMLSVQKERSPHKRLEYMLEARKCATSLGQPVRKFNKAILELMLVIAERNPLEDEQIEDYKRALEFAEETGQFYHKWWIKAVLKFDELLRRYEKDKKRIRIGFGVFVLLLVGALGMRFFTTEHSNIALPLGGNKGKEEVKVEKPVDKATSVMNQHIDVVKQIIPKLAKKEDVTTLAAPAMSRIEMPDGLDFKVAQCKFISDDKRRIYYELYSGNILMFYGYADTLMTNNHVVVEDIQLLMM